MLDVFDFGGSQIFGFASFLKSLLIAAFLGRWLRFDGGRVGGLLLAQWNQQIATSLVVAAIGVLAMVVYVYGSTSFASLRKEDLETAG